MEVAKYPTMRFELAGVTVDPPAAAPPDTVHATLRGRLTIHGVTREVAAPATLVGAGEAISVDGGFPLDLADYRIGGLTRFLGALRMQRNVEVRFRLRFDATSRTATGTTTSTTTPIER
jgi:polyisoprenoid-binding protein YceI